MDRAEWTGTGAALLFHVALIGALSMSLASVDATPESPAMDVEFVEEVGLTAAAPQAIAVPPPPSQAPEIGEAEPVEAPTPVPPAPTPTPAPTPIVKPTPPKPVAPSRPAPRVTRIGEDFLKGINKEDDLAPRPGPAPKPVAAQFDAVALASIQQAIRRQIQPCADRQVDPGPGANRIRVTLNIRLAKSGRLIGAPQVVRTSGIDDENARYEERVKDLAVAAYRGCAPLTGLPPELYQTPQGGWSNINMTYRLP
ncbi:MAG TPA: hypothetical protein VFR36_04925 [Sphingomicrobium sp.]|nr:hypothetical protein [Sphingomicrobium sp.]